MNSVVMFDVCAIGYITKDIVKTKTAEKTMPGGVGYYFSIALKNLGSNNSLITKVAEKDKSLLKDLIKDNIIIFNRYTQATTVFENIYPEENMDIRIQKVHCVAQPFNLEDIQNISSHIYHLGPLTKEDIPLKIIKHLSRKGKISLDIQGFLRKIEKGEVKNIDWKEKDEGLTYINILKADETEAKIISGEENIKKAAVKLSAYGIDEIIITLGSKGSLIYCQEKFYFIPSFPARKVVDATGCGDTYMAGYIYKRLKSSDINESGRFAAALASLKLEKSGPFNGSEEDVQNFLSQAELFPNLSNYG
ncbi:MAG: PfkB family carbohydrate kinase [Xenococcaceae cyanobacterium]